MGDPLERHPVFDKWAEGDRVKLTLHGAELEGVITSVFGYTDVAPSIEIKLLKGGARITLDSTSFGGECPYTFLRNGEFVDLTKIEES